MLSIRCKTEYGEGSDADEIADVTAEVLAKRPKPVVCNLADEFNHED